MSTSEPKEERVFSYIDGFNLYFGLIEAGLECYKWLDVNNLAALTLRPHQKLKRTRYFTSLIAKPQQKVDRQSAYINALRTVPKIEIHYGKYERDKEITCSACTRKTSHSQEKMTDVNIAVSMIEDAYNDAFDTALLISGDSDLCPPISAIRRLFPSKRVVVAFPPSRISKELSRVASAAVHLRPPDIKNSQFSNEIVTTNGYVIRRPAHESYTIPAPIPCLKLWKPVQALELPRPTPGAPPTR